MGKFCFYIVHCEAYSGRLPPLSLLMTRRPKRAKEAENIVKLGHHSCTFFLSDGQIFHGMWDVFIAPTCSRVLSHLLVAGCDISVWFSVRLSTFMSKFDIYVKVSILINYKTKQPSNLVWNSSLTSWLCDIGVRFSVRLSVLDRFQTPQNANKSVQQVCALNPNDV